MNLYAEVNGFAENEIDYDDFVYTISVLDETFLDVTRKQAETAQRRGGR